MCLKVTILAIRFAKGLVTQAFASIKYLLVFSCVVLDWM